MNIRRARCSRAQALAALALALLSGCDLAPGPEIQRLSEARMSDGQSVTLPYNWPRAQFVQGTVVQVPFTHGKSGDSLGVYLGPTTLT